MRNKKQDKEMEKIATDRTKGVLPRVFQSLSKNDIENL